MRAMFGWPSAVALEPAPLRPLPNGCKWSSSITRAAPEGQNSFHRGGEPTKMWLHPALPHLYYLAPRWMHPAPPLCPSSATQHCQRSPGDPLQCRRPRRVSLCALPRRTRSTPPWAQRRGPAWFPLTQDWRQERMVSPGSRGRGTTVCKGGKGDDDG
jgi:hypothetical protein